MEARLLGPEKAMPEAEGKKGGKADAKPLVHAKSQMMLVFIVSSKKPVIRAKIPKAMRPRWMKRVVPPNSRRF